MNTTIFFGAKNRTAEPPPVFVDDSGRKQRNMKRLGWLAAILCAAFLGLVGVGLATENVGPTGAGVVPGPFMLQPASLGQPGAPVAPAPKPVVQQRPRVVTPPVTTTTTAPKCSTTDNGAPAGSQTDPKDPCAPKTDPKTDPKPDPNPNPNPDTGTDPGTGNGSGTGNEPSGNGGQPAAQGS